MTHLLHAKLRHPQTYLVKPVDVRDEPKRHRALAIYYGPDALSTLTRFRRVVVQPGHFRDEQVAWLQERGVQVLAYLSLGEDEGDPAAWHTGTLRPEWNTHQVDARHPAWRAQLQTQVTNYSRIFDGFFLDTLDSALDDPQQKRAMLKLVRQVRSWAGPKYLLANRGFSLLERLRGTLDGVLIEAFSTTWQDGYRVYTDGELAYTEGLLAQARRLRLDVYALDYANTPALKRFARSRAASLGLSTFVSNRELSLPAGFTQTTPPEP